MEGLKKYDYYDKGFSPKIQQAYKFLALKDFHIALHLERIRSDRSEQEFSLILFEINKVNNPAMISQFIAILHKRMRAFDSAGWFNEDHVGIILPFSDMEGACKFAVKVEKKIIGNCSALPYTIFTYPDHWIENDSTDNKKTTHKAYTNNSNIIDIENVKPFFSVTSGFKKRWETKKHKIQAVFVRKIPWWKRMTDIILSSIALLILSPLFLVVSVCIKILSPGPVFFKQKRIGYKGKQFTMFKFRTMKVNNNDAVHKEYAKQFIKSDQKLVKLDNKNDKRIIPGGRFLRKACIDELPQLINVLRGEMSIVGPRPPILYEVDEYDYWHIKRFDVMPGLTGLWQVSGKQKLTFNQMIRMDIRYRNKLSFFFDLYIMIKTIPTIFGMIFEAAFKKINTMKEKFHVQPLKTIKKPSLYLLIFEMFSRIR